MEARAVDDARDHLLDFERLAHVDGRDAENLLGVVDRLFDGDALRLAQLAPIELGHDFAADADGIAFVRREVVGDPRDAAVHLGASQLLLGAVLVDRHLHQRGAAEKDLGPLLHHDDVVGHAGHVGAARRGRAEDEADRRDALGRAACEFAEHAPPGHEDLGLVGQVGAGRLGEVDDGHPVLGADLHGARDLAPAVGVDGAAPHGGLVGGDHALHAGDHADAADRAAAEAELRPPGAERGDFEEGRVAVEEQLDALAGHQLAAPRVALDVLLAAAGPRQRELLVQVGDLLEKALPIGPVGLGAGVDVGGEGLHRGVRSRLRSPASSPGSGSSSRRTRRRC